MVEIVKGMVSRFYMFKSPEDVVASMSEVLGGGNELWAGKYREHRASFSGKMAKLLLRDNSEVSFRCSLDLVVPHEIAMLHVSDGKKVGRIDVDYGWIGRSSSDIYGKMDIVVDERLVIGSGELYPFSVKILGDNVTGKISRWDRFSLEDRYGDFLIGELFGDECFIEEKYLDKVIK